MLNSNGQSSLHQYWLKRLCQEKEADTVLPGIMALPGALSRQLTLQALSGMLLQGLYPRHQQLLAQAQGAAAGDHLEEVVAAVAAAVGRINGFTLALPMLCNIILQP